MPGPVDLIALKGLEHILLLKPSGTEWIFILPVKYWSAVCDGKELVKSKIKSVPLCAPNPIMSAMSSLPSSVGPRIAFNATPRDYDP
jgi:hypothetical protein